MTGGGYTYLAGRFPAECRAIAVTLAPTAPGSWTSPQLDMDIDMDTGFEFGELGWLT
jgi:hypothetical protein